MTYAPPPSTPHTRILNFNILKLYKYFTSRAQPKNDFLEVKNTFVNKWKQNIQGVQKNLVYRFC